MDEYQEALLGHPAVGASWEGYVIKQIIRDAPKFRDFYFYRTQNGVEVDLMRFTQQGRKVCIEIKFSVAPVICRGFYTALEDLQPDHKYIITPGGEKYRRSDGLCICPLKEFLTSKLPGL